MIVYQDVFNGDEMFSDSFPMKEVDDIVYQVQCKMISLEAVEVDTGANASAEEAEEGTDDVAITVNNVVHSAKLQETQFDKKGFMAFIKGMMKRIKEKLEADQPDRVEGFQKSAQAFIKKVIGEFDEYQFFFGENFDMEAGIGLMKYLSEEEGGDGMNPVMFFFKDAVKEVKY